MSVTLEDSSNSIPRYIGHRELTEDDIRYNEELDKEDEQPLAALKEIDRIDDEDAQLIRIYIRRVLKMKTGTVCGGNKKFCDFWNSVFKEEMQTQKGKKTIRPSVPRRIK